MINLNAKSPPPMIVIEILIVSLIFFPLLPFWFAVRMLRR